MSIHADDERLNDELTIEQIEFVLKDCEIIETYPFDPRGESCLVWGKFFGSFVHYYRLYSNHAEMVKSKNQEPIR